jgi:hypothetical protein
MAKEKMSETARGLRLLVIGLASLCVPAAAWTYTFTMAAESQLQTAGMVAFFSSLVAIGLISSGLLIVLTEVLKGIGQRRRMREAAHGRAPRRSPAFVFLVIGLVLAVSAGLGWISMPRSGSYDSGMLMTGWMTVFATWGAGMMLIAAAVTALVEAVRASAKKR